MRTSHSLFVFACTLVILCGYTPCTHAGATPLEQPITLEKIRDRLNNEFVIGDKRFSNFSLHSEATGGGLPLDESSTFVQGFIIDNFIVALQFTLAGAQIPPNSSIDLFLDYEVEFLPQYPDFFIVQTGQRLNGVSALGTGLVRMDETILDSTGTNVLGTSYTSRVDDQSQDRLTDVTDITPQRSIVESLHLQIDAGPQGVAAISGFVQVFTQEIPEPTTMCLLAAGIMHLRRRRRSARQTHVAA